MESGTDYLLVDEIGVREPLRRSLLEHRGAVLLRLLGLELLGDSLLPSQMISNVAHFYLIFILFH